MKRFIFSTFIILLLTGCVTTKSSDLMIEHKIDAPKVLTVKGTRAPWVYEIEKRLKKRGFTIKRIASQSVSTEVVSDNKVSTYNEASAPFVLLIDGYAPNNAMERCFGGGYNFSYIDIEMVNLINNETVLHYNNSGYSEGCPPLSGTIFTDIENLISSAWE